MGLARAIGIVAIALRHRLDEALLPWARARGMAWLVPAHWRRNSGDGALGNAYGQRLCRALDELGPVFVKLGQLLSVRPDLVPEPIAAELAALRDRVTPVPAQVIRQLLEDAYGAPVEAVFAEFEAAPVASASIAQVHRARLHDGAEVAVKVVRPGIAEVIRRDLGLLRALARVGERLVRDARRLRASEVVDLYEGIILNELDMLREAANGAQLARNFAGTGLLRVPAVHWPLTRPNVLVSEFLTGIPLDRRDLLVKSGLDLEALAERGVEIFFTQVFVHNFFHADMHPGNISADLDAAPGAPGYLAVDFGIMGTLGREDQRYLAENFLAFFNRDYRRVAELHVASGWVPAGTRVEELEAAIRTVCEPIFERPLGEIAFGQLLVRLFRVARRFDMEVQPDLVLLQKTLLHIEGLGRQLHPELDLWRTARPFFERWMRERSGPVSLARALADAAPRWAAVAAELGPRLPDVVRRRALELERGERSRPVPARRWPPVLPAVVAVLGLGLVLAGAAGAGLLLVGLGLGLWLAREPPT